MGRWSGCENKNEEEFLPESKQFLITERVPCSRRVDDLEDHANQVHEVVVDDEWTEVQNNEAGEGNEVVDVDMEENKEEEKKAEDDESSEEVDIDAEMEAMNNAAA